MVRGLYFLELKMGSGLRHKTNILIIFGLLYFSLSAFCDDGYDFIRPKREPVISASVNLVPGNPIRIWVAFTDKGIFTTEEYSAAVGKLDISQRTLARRAKMGAAPEIQDLPVNQDYLAQLEPFVIAINQSSRWLNAVSATIFKEKLPDIANLPFVAEIRPVAKGESCERFRWEEAVSWKGVDGYNENYAHLGHEGAFYGNSYDQLDQIGVIEAHRRGLYGEGVIITIMDGGFMVDHRSLTHSDVLAEWDFINNDPFTGYDPEQDIRAQPRHGTAVMSNIASFDPGNLIGAAPYASFMLAKTEDIRDETPAEEDNMVAAIEWAEWNGTDVISTSLSYSDWYVAADYDGIIPYASRAVQRAFEMGVVFVTSMGNAGPRPMTMGAPADAEGSISVGGVDSTSTLVRFSSRGPTADGRIKPNVLAMARHVTVARPYTYDEFSLANGTSFSCPLAAGALALLIQAHPDWPSYKIMEAAENTADRASYPDNDWGYGILRVDKALDYPSLSGYIIDAETNQPIPDAEIHFISVDTSGVIAADSLGYYFGANFTGGKYSITAVANGYLESDYRTIILPPDEYCDFALTPH